MKTRLFLLGLCSLALAATACSVDETPQTNTATNAISFKATAPYASRAAAVTTNSLNSFTVWGWTDSKTVMDHVTATRDGGGSVYSTSPTYYWPGDAVDFLALTPAADANLYDGTSKTSYIGGEFSGYEIREEGGTAEEYTGYVAEAVIEPMEGEGSVRLNVPSDSKDQIDLCYAYTPERTTGAVTMNFRHALSQITFAARTTNTEQEVRIKGVKVCSVGNWGFLDLPFVTTETNLPTDDIGTDGISDSQGTWELGPVYNGTQFSAGLGLGADGYITVPTDGTSVTLSASDGSLLLIPQEVAEWDTCSDPTLDGVGAYFRVECAILGEDGSLLWPNDGTSEFAEIAIPVDVTWVEGYKYTYTFVFGEGLGYYPPDDATDAGKPIPFLPIKFDINIDEFQATDGVDVSAETDSRVSSNSINGHEYVDLGFTSPRVVWATCNVGASSPEEYGGYFAWGEIETKDKYSTDNYTLNDERYSTIVDISGNPAYDAATANWGEPWRMPTLTEFTELMESCNLSLTTIEGVLGFTATNPGTDDSIFFPAGGNMKGDGFDGGQINTCVYWTSTTNSFFLAYAFMYLCLEDDEDGPYFEPYEEWYKGLSIRPVATVE